VTRPRSTAVVRPATNLKTSINVTPLVDVVLVLLIIFMVVMPLLEKQFAVHIPETDEVEMPSEVPETQVVVRVERDGAFTINGEATTAEGYVQALKERLEPRAADARVVFVSAENEAPYPRLVQALEGAQQAGAATLAMAPEPSPEAAATPAPLP